MDDIPQLPAPVELKRSSWNAGMMGRAPVPPPGSPAAWRQRQQTPGDGVTGSGIQSPSRPSSPLRFMTVPGSNGNVMPPPRSASPIRRTADASPSPAVPNPFNFESNLYVPSSPSSKKTMGQRRGHRYKHSSVSMNFFQEPEERAPLAIPVSLAVPTVGEWYQSMTHSQAQTLLWCGLRVAVAMFVLAYASLGPQLPESMATLAHLLAYDAVMAATIAAADILANFDAWKTSSLRLPFALQRVEVLLGFALAITLMFLGGDIISHTVQHSAQAFYAGSEDAHAHAHTHGHGHDQVKASVMHFILIGLSMMATLPSVINKNRMGFVTLSFAFAVLMVPLVPGGTTLDAMLTPVMGLAMTWLGWGTAKLFGGMLVMSYGGPDHTDAIISKVTADPSVTSVSEVNLWQVHHDLWLASMRITISGALSDERRVREESVRAIRETVPDANWDTTIDITSTTQ